MQCMFIIIMLISTCTYQRIWLKLNRVRLLLCLFNKYLYSFLEITEMSTCSKNSQSKKQKLKKLKLKTIATDYLNNCIQLNESNDIKIKYFENLIQDQFVCFLHLNGINSDGKHTNEFLNFYKARQTQENRSKNEFGKFLELEFSQNEYSSYINSFLSSNHNKKTNIPSINIVPNSKKASLSENAELEYLKSGLDQNPEVAPSNLTLSSTQSSTSINLSHTGKLISKFNTNNKKSEYETMFERRQLVNSKLNSNSNSIYQRTISESSNESCLVVLNRSSINRSNNTNHKSNLYTNLKRMACEKMLFMSNNAPLGVISHLPFRLNSTRLDPNESFMSRSRHLSHSTKPVHNQNSFMIDVFEMLDLDVDQYINYGAYSYSSLLDHNSKRHFDDSQQNAPKIDFTIEDKEEKYNDIGENQEMRLGQARKDSKPFVITSYQADYLDDPKLTEMTAGKNRTCLKFASYAISIIDYVKPLELKKEINETFKEKFPYIQISLTKLRSIKRELLELAIETNIDIAIVAQSYIFFEKLILQGLINKTNRKHLAANCLILAAKLNDTSKKDISKLIDATINKFRFDNRREMISFEFPVLVALEFNLITKYETEFFTHYQKILTSVDSNKSFRIRTLSD